MLMLTKAECAQILTLLQPLLLEEPSVRLIPMLRQLLAAVALWHNCWLFVARLCLCCILKAQTHRPPTIAGGNA
jgi:hypothetical protein